MSDPLRRKHDCEGSPATSTYGPRTEGDSQMKQMILTGLATEQRFGNPEPQFYLVFNEGELRVPVDPTAAEAIVATMYGGNGTPETSTAQPQEVDEDLMHADGDDYASEADIPQA